MVRMREGAERHRDREDSQRRFQKVAHTPLDLLLFLFYRVNYGWMM